MNVLGFACIGLGAALGAWLRWLLGLVLNPLFEPLALGTLAANLLGGLLMGVAMGLFAGHTALSPELRLFVVTGFLGGLTTFSTFSGEAANLLTRQDYTWAGLLIGAHVMGSIAATLGGIILVRLLLRG